MEGAVLIAAHQPVHRQGVDGVGEGGVGYVGEHAALKIQPQLLRQSGGGHLGPGGAAAAPVQLGRGGQGLQQLGEGVPVVRVAGGALVDIEGEASQLQLQGAVGDGGLVGAQKQGGGLGVPLGDEQSGEDTHRVVGGPVGGIEAVSGDFQAVPVKELGDGAVGGVLIQHRLSHTLAVGALADGNADVVGPDGGGEHLRSAGAPWAGEDHHGHIGEVGGVRPDGPVVGQTVPAHHIDHDPAFKPAQREGHCRVGASGVGAQVHYPEVGIVPHLLQGLPHRVGGGGTEAVAGDVAHIPVHQIIGDNGDGDRLALQGEVLLLPGAVEADGESDGGTHLPADQGGGVHAGGEGNAVHCQDAVPGGQSGLLGGGVVQDGEDLDSVVHGVLDGHADAHHRLTVHLVQECLVLLRRHVYSVGVVQGLQDGLGGVQIQNLLGDFIHIVGFQQHAGVLRLQSGGGESTQAEDQGGGQKAGKNAMFHGSLLFWISRAPDATGIRRRTYDYSFEVR